MHRFVWRIFSESSPWYSTPRQTTRQRQLKSSATEPSMLLPQSSGLKKPSALSLNEPSSRVSLHAYAAHPLFSFPLPLSHTRVFCR